MLSTGYLFRLAQGGSKEARVALVRRIWPEILEGLADVLQGRDRWGREKVLVEAKAGAERAFLKKPETVEEVIDAAVQTGRRFAEAQALAAGEFTLELTDEEAAYYQAMFEHLTDRQRQVVYLRHVRGMNFNEIAEALGISRQAAQQSLSAAHERLRKAGLLPNEWGE